MMDIAEVSAAPHFPQALQKMIAGGRQNALREFMAALGGTRGMDLCELNGELYLVGAADPGE